MIKKINKMLYDFLWDGKPDQIKRRTARNKLENGGIDMIDIENFDKALKLTWIRRFLKYDTKWKSVITEIYPNLNEISCFGDNFLKILLRNISNPFWKNVISYYLAFYKKIGITSLEELYETSFLFNDNIKIKNDIIKNKEFIKKEIFFIKNLMEDGDFLSFEQFTAKYNINIDFITYHSILSSIKKYTCFKNLEDTGIVLKGQPAIDIITKTKKGASLIYRKLIDECTIDSKGKSKWASVTDISNEDWHNAFSFLKWTTKDTKLRWLQYRILHSILTTNRSVSKLKENQRILDANFR